METDTTDLTTQESENILGVTFELKEEIQSLCDKLATHGEESVFISTNKIENTSCCRGSTVGLDFIFKKLDIIDQFYNYCRGNDLNKDNSDIFKSDELDTTTAESDENDTGTAESDDLDPATVESDELDSDPGEFVDTCNDTSSFSMSTNDKSSNDSPSEKDTFKDLHKSKVKIGNDSYQNRKDENEPIDPEYTALKKYVISALSESESVDTVVDKLGSNDSNIDLDMCVTDGKEEIAQHMQKEENSNTKVKYTGIKGKETDKEFKKIHLKVKDSVINPKYTGTDLVKCLDAKTVLPASGKNTSVINKRVTLVPLLRKRMIASDISKETPKLAKMADLKNKNLILKKLGGQEKKVINLDIAKGAKMFIVPAKKKEDFPKKVIGYSTANTQTKAQSPASSLIVKPQPMHVSETEKLETSDKGNGYTLRKRRPSRTTSYEESNKEPTHGFDKQPNGQESSEDSLIISTALKNLSVDLQQLEKEKMPQSASIVYPDGSVEKVPVKTGDKPDGYNSDTGGKVVEEGDIKSYIVYRKKYSRFNKKEREIHQCKICNKIYKRKHNLKDHISKHTGEFPYSCSICDRKFSKREPYQTHLNNHLEIKPYMCEMCGKRFASSGLLKTHAVVHFSEKTYVCKVCDKKFLRRNYLVKHLQFHRNEKKYMCEECGKSFFTSGHLRRHTVIHSGVKPYRCELCPYECNQAGNLKIHMKVHKQM